VRWRETPEDPPSDSPHPSSLHRRLMPDASTPSPKKKTREGMTSPHGHACPSNSGAPTRRPLTEAPTRLFSRLGSNPTPLPNSHEAPRVARSGRGGLSYPLDPIANPVPKPRTLFFAPERLSAPDLTSLSATGRNCYCEMKQFEVLLWPVVFKGLDHAPATSRYAGNRTPRPRT
jgi:hypothetical protein